MAPMVDADDKSRGAENAGHGIRRRVLQMSQEYDALL